MRGRHIVFVCLLLAVMAVVSVSSGCSGSKTSSAPGTPAPSPSVPPVTTSLTTGPAPTTSIVGTPITTPVNLPTKTFPTITATPPTTTTPAPTGTLKAAVTVTGEIFVPASLTVTVGTIVTWTNLDAEDHTVTSATGLFSGILPAVPGSFSYTFTKAGTYNYFCSIHTYMTGTIIVK